MTATTSMIESGSRRVVTAATVWVLGCAVAIPVWGVYRVALNADRAALTLALAATVVVAPLQVWLLLAAMRGRVTRVHRWVLAGTAAVVVVALPVVGFTWLAAFFPLAALVLVVAARPWAVPLFLAASILPAPLAHLLGQPRWATYFATGTLMFGLAVAVPTWLAAAIDQLRQTRAQLARRAVLAQRLRIDGELRDTVTAQLSHIVAHADQAAAGLHADPAGAAEQVTAVVDRSRAVLRQVRRLVGAYEAVPLPAELQAFTDVYAAADIASQREWPADAAAPTTLHESTQQHLGTQARALLAPGGVHHSGHTMVASQGDVQVPLTAQGTGSQVAP